MNQKNNPLNLSEQFKGIFNATYIEKGGYVQLARKTIYFIALMIVVFILWATFTQINEVAVSYGEVMPLHDVHVMQHLQGGVIEKLFVKNGQEVRQGEPLMKLNPEILKADLQKAQSREVSLLLNAKRLRAFIDKHPEAKIDWYDTLENHPYNVPSNTAHIQKSIQKDINLLHEQNTQRENQYRIFLERISQKKSELKQYTDTKIQTEKKLKLHEKEEEMYESVVEKGYVSKRDYLIAQRKTIEATSQLKQITAKINTAKSALLETQGELKNLDSVLVKESLEELDAIDAELLTIRHTIQRLSEFDKQLLIKAPIAGIIKGLTAQPGSVISPAQGVLEIVPTRGEMVVQAKVSTKDIGHIRVGDPVHVKVMSFEFTRYGIVNGKVTEISASTFTNEEGLPYYEAEISLEKNHVGDNPKVNHLKPGMTVQADIITGKKSVISYLLKPITRGLQSSFRER